MNIEYITKEDFMIIMNEFMGKISSMHSPQKYFRTREMMELLDCSENQLRNLRAKGEIKAAKIGGDWYYDYKSIEKKFNNQG